MRAMTNDEIRVEYHRVLREKIQELEKRIIYLEKSNKLLLDGAIQFQLILAELAKPIK